MPNPSNTEKFWEAMAKDLMKVQLAFQDQLLRQNSMLSERICTLIALQDPAVRAQQAVLGREQVELGSLRDSPEVPPDSEDGEEAMQKLLASYGVPDAYLLGEGPPAGSPVVGKVYDQDELDEPDEANEPTPKE